jgi:hypothetical protein
VKLPFQSATLGGGNVCGMPVSFQSASSWPLGSGPRAGSGSPFRHSGLARASLYEFACGPTDRIASDAGANVLNMAQA